MCAPSFARALPGALAARDGAPLLLSCAVRGDPDPRVQWHKDGKPLHSSEVSPPSLPTACVYVKYGVKVYKDGRKPSLYVRSKNII